MCSCGTTGSSRRSATPRPSSPGSSWIGSGGGSGRSRAGRRSSPSPATSSSTRSATSRSSWCAGRTGRSARSTTPASTAARGWPRGAAASPTASCSAATTPGGTRSTAGSPTSSTPTSSPTCPRVCGSPRCGPSAGAGSSSSTPTRDAEPLLEFLDPLPALLAPYRLEDLRFRAQLRTVLPANWKSVVDAFNESYHVQGTHPQILAWTDDVSIAYEQLGKHARYGRLAGARRELRPSPRLGLTEDEYDEGEILAALVAGPRWRVPRRRAGAGGRASGRRSPARRAAARVPAAPARAARGARARRLGHRARADDERRGCVLLPERRRPHLPRQRDPVPRPSLRARPRPGHPRDLGARVAAPGRGATPGEPARRADDWTERDWGEITNQDYANMAEVQTGMKSAGFDGTPPEPAPGGQPPPHAPRPRHLPGGLMESVNLGATGLRVSHASASG